MIKRLLNQKIDSVTAAALVVGVSSLLSRLLGVVRDRILAGQFGAGDSLDVYYAAFRVPDLIFNLVVLGALSAGFIPVFSQLIKEHPAKGEQPEAWNLVNNIINLLGLLLLAVSVLGIILAPQLMKLITPGFSGDKLALTVQLTRLMFWSPLLLGLSSIIGGVLQSFKRFFAYSLSPIFYNLGIIVGAVWLVPLIGISGLAWGVVLGSALHALIQLPALFRLGFKYRWLLNWHAAAVRQISRMMTARTLSLVVNQLNLVVVTALASTLSSGSLAVFNLANNLQSFPVGIFGISFAIAVFPALATIAFDKEGLMERLAKTARQVLFFIVPATVLLLVLRAQVVRLILGSGNFDWQDTILTMDSLSLFSLSLFAQALIPLQIRVFYARHNSQTPLYLGLVAAAINVALAWWLVRPLGVRGLALAFSVAAIINFILLALALRRELGALMERQLIGAVAKLALAGLVSGLVMQLVKSWLGQGVDMERFWGVFIQAAVAGGCGLLVYWLTARLLKSQEAIDFWGYLKFRLPTRPTETGDQGEARGI